MHTIPTDTLTAVRAAMCGCARSRGYHSRFCPASIPSSALVTALTVFEDHRLDHLRRALTRVERERDDTEEYAADLAADLDRTIDALHAATATP